MTFAEYARYLDRVEMTPSRNEMTEILADLVKKMDSDDARCVAYLLQGRVAPVFEDLEFNVAEKLMVRAIAFAFGLNEESVIADFKRLGDLGTVVEEYRKKSSKIAVDLEINDVFTKLKNVVLYSGKGSQDKKILELAGLFKDLDSLSCRYIARIPIGKMRLGLSAKTALDVISWAEAGNKSYREIVEKAYYSSSDLGLVMEVYKKDGMMGLEKMEPSLGTPVFAKLVERIPTTEEIIEKMGPVHAQPKFDGLRCQAHKWIEDGKTRVKLFSRNLEDLTEMFPDVVEAVKTLNADSLIIDSEVIGYNSATDEFIPFQKTMNRKRKYGIGEKTKEVPVFLFAFDLLHLNGRNLMNEPLEERLSLLKSLVPKDSLIHLTETTIFDDAKTLEKYFNECVSEGLEGIIVKKKGTIYEPGTRNFDWVKLKRAMKSHLSDTVDVVIMGYYVGKGRLTQFGMGALLAGVYDDANDEFVTIAKVGTGIPDDLWRKIGDSLKPIVVDRQPNNYNVNSLLIPDFWVEPKIVCQIRADEITRSPIHTCAKDSSGIGYALRFPRMEIFGRDKLSDDCTTVKEIVEMFSAQLSPK